MTAIAIGEGVNENQAVMKASSDFVGVKGFVFDPVFNIVAKLE